jgi:photosystem II stability/assembly factor-like uncharacterized protein
MIPEMRRHAPAWLLTGAALLATAGPAVGQDGAQPPEYSIIRPLATSELLIDAAQVDGLTVAVGTRGIVLLSEDNGESWRQVSVPTRSMLTGVYFADRQHGWAVGHDAVIIRTDDGGESWSQVYFDPERETPLFDVWFDDVNNGIAVGAYGFLLRTTDGGLNWEEDVLEVVAESEPEEEERADVDVDVEATDEEEEEEEFWEEDVDGPADFHFNRIDEAPDGSLLIAAEAGNLYRSTDRGRTWQWLDSGYEGSFFTALALDERSIVAVGLRGSVYRSEDGGDSFRRVETPVEVLLNEAALMPDGRVVVVGMSGTILVSEDQGQTFYLVQREDRKALTQVVPAGDDGVLIFGEAGPFKLAAADLRRE